MTLPWYEMTIPWYQMTLPTTRAPAHRPSCWYDDNIVIVAPRSNGVSVPLPRDSRHLPKDTRQDTRRLPKDGRQGTRRLPKDARRLPNTRTQPVGLSEVSQVPENLRRPDLYFNRELSLIEYNQRVLDEAANDHHPLLERIRSLYFFSTNIYEFFMIRVSGLREQVAAGLGELSPDRMPATEQLAAIREKLLPLLDRQSHLLCDELLPALAQHGIHVVDIGDVTPDERTALDAYYEREVFPVLTPLAVDPGHPFPHISN